MSQIEIVNCAILYIESKISDIKKQLRIDNSFALQLELAQLEVKLKTLYTAY